MSSVVEPQLGDAFIHHLLEAFRFKEPIHLQLGQSRDMGVAIEERFDRLDRIPVEQPQMIGSCLVFMVLLP